MSPALPIHPLGGVLPDVSEEWTVELQPADGGTPELSNASFRKMRLVWTAEGPGSAEIDLRETDVLADQSAWTPGLHRVIVRGERDFAGDLTRLVRTGGPGESKVGYKASALGLASRLDLRVVRHAFVVNDEAAIIVEALLNEAQNNQFNGNMGMQIGTVTGTTVSRRRSYCVGVKIGDAIAELASIKRGFDWEIDADGNLNIWDDTRGVDTGLWLHENQTENFEIEMDTSELLTNVTALADPSDPWGPKSRMANVLSGAGVFFAHIYGRREVTIDTDIVADNDKNPDWEQELFDAGRAVLATNLGGHLRVRARWNSADAPWSLQDVWLQDQVTLELPEWCGGPRLCRVTDVTVTIEAMPPRGDAPPIYWIEYGFDALVRELDLQDNVGDEGEEAVELPPLEPPPDPPETGTRILGAWTEFNGDGNWSLSENRQFDTLTGVKMAASMHYASWTDAGIESEITASYGEGRVLTHIAWPARGGRPTDIVAGVISGKYDSVIEAMANHLENARDGNAMQWRPFWEMNGAWQPWNAVYTAHDPSRYRQMFQRVVTVGRAAGFGGEFVWSPNAYSSTQNSWDTLESYYPGDAYVDIVGVSGYNGFTANNVPWREYSAVVAAIETVAANHGKPLCLSEGSSIEDRNTPGRKAQWIRNMFNYLLVTPEWETILWFHRPAVATEAKDYRVNSSASSLAAWQDVAAGGWPDPPLPPA